MATPSAPAPFLWLSDAEPAAKDDRVAFRAEFDLPTATEVQFRLLGSSWYNLWLDANYLGDGPPRYPLTHPEYQTFRAQLPAGRHVIALEVHNLGIPTRSLLVIEPFVACSALAHGAELPLRWKCARLAGYASAVRRINPVLGFIEWCDTRQVPAWRAPAFDDTAWGAPVAVTRPIGEIRPLPCANPLALPHTLTPVASGELVETFGYERDDIPARFFLRDLSAGELTAQGVWRRYDLGRVRLMRPRFELDLPAGAVVEFAYCEALRHGRVHPWINLSTGDSCNFDHYVARGGPQEFFPLTPRGGRFMEIHVLAPPAAVKFLRESAVERVYYGEPEGALRTGDALLDQIWRVGVETHRACAEDALTDNPTRERAQWAGDVVSVGMDIAAVAFADLRLCRRSLVQCAQRARDDGLVAGLGPGQPEYLTTYAAQWITACLHYWEITGDRAILEEMLPYAEANIGAFNKNTTADGVQDAMGWGFVDWGYVRNPGPVDIAVNLHVLAAIRDMVRWCEALQLPDRAAHHRQLAANLTAIIARYYAGEFAAGGDVWSRIGYHRAALGLRLGFFDAAQSAAGRAHLQAHMLRCFPNRADAPRLSDPAANNPQLITPYFGHFALPELIEHGEMDFVLGQYRTAWGWALGGGRTTWLEVFDTRWSHCHQWSGCPTWQLSRALLGLAPRFDLGEMHFDFSLHTGALEGAEGTLPLAGRAETIRVAWTKDAAGLHYRLTTPLPLTLHVAGTKIPVARDYTATFALAACR